MSDTHGYFDTKLKDVFSDVDEIWHAGDIGSLEVLTQLEKFKPYKAVFGNIDGTEIRQACKETLVFNCQGLNVLVTHIGGYPGNYSPKAKKLIEENRPDLFICGHSHILKVMRDEKHGQMLTMNPGAAGQHGFHKFKTVLRFNILNGKIENLEAIELGKRGEMV